MQIRFLLEEEFLNEGHLNRVTMGFQIKNHQNLDVTLKKHSYPGYLELIKKQNNIEDLKYLRSDVNISINLVKNIKQRIEKVKKYGDCGETHRYYKKINEYIQKGITVRDCDLTLKWFKEICLKEISKKIKELKLKEKI